MTRRPPRSTRTDTLFPYTTLFRARCERRGLVRGDRARVVARVLAGAQADHFDPPDTAIADADLDRGGVAQVDDAALVERAAIVDRSEEHTSELQSLMRISYAVFCLKKKTPNQ